MKNKYLLVIKIVVLIFSVIALCILVFNFYTKQTDKVATLDTRVSKNEKYLDKNVEYADKGIVNYLELKDLDPDFSYILEPVFNKYTEIQSYIDKNPLDVYSEVEKEDIFCITNGRVKPDYNVRFPYQNYEIEIDYTDFLPRLMEQVNKTHPTINIDNYLLTSCWKKSDDGNTRITHPDFGLLQQPPTFSADNRTLGSQTIVFSGYYNFVTIPNSTSIVSVQPLFFNPSNEFYILYEIHGGGWLDAEVVIVDFNSGTYSNRDTCASIVPISSINPSYETGCFVGIEGRPDGDVPDYGFSERE